MNRKKKIVLFSTTALFLPSLINHSVFFWANYRDKKEDIDQFYKSQLGTVHYSIKGNGRPLLLFHTTQIGSSLLEWEKNIEFLSNYYKVFAIDLPGFGHSQRQKITYTAYHYAQFINSFIQEIVKRPVSIIANEQSAVFCTKAYELEPSNIKKLILIAPKGISKNCYPTQEEKKKLTFFGIPLIGTSIYTYLSSFKKIKEFLFHTAFFAKEKVSIEIIQKYYLSAHRGGVNNRYVFSSFYSHFMDADIKEVLKKIKIPVCIIWGENNIENSIDNMEILKQLRPDFSYYIFEQTRMLPQYENNEEFNKVIKEFLN